MRATEKSGQRRRSFQLREKGRETQRKGSKLDDALVELFHGRYLLDLFQPTLPRSLIEVGWGEFGGVDGSDVVRDGGGSYLVEGGSVDVLFIAVLFSGFERSEVRF